jgi:hypothetical protein
MVSALESSMSTPSSSSASHAEWRRQGAWCVVTYSWFLIGMGAMLAAIAGHLTNPGLVGAVLVGAMLTAGVLGWGHLPRRRSGG